FFFQAEDGIRDVTVTGVQTCALPICVGSLEPSTLAAADLDSAFREKPAVHRFPGSMARRVHDLAAHIQSNYDGHAERVWTESARSEERRVGKECRARWEPCQ